MDETADATVDGDPVDEVAAALDAPAATTDDGDAAPGDRSVDPDAVLPGGRNLPVAIAVGVVLGALFLGSLFLGSPAVFTAVVTIVIAIAVWEAGTQLATTEHTVARPVLVVAAVVSGAATHALGVQGQLLGMLVLVLGAFGWELASSPRVGVVDKLGTTLLLGTWVIFPASYVVLLVNRDEGAVAAVLLVLGAAIFGDIGAYAVGRLVGRHPIAPTVSPNKTWEGFLGGVVVAAVVAAAVLPLVDTTVFGDPLDAALIAALCAVAGFFGDLGESMVKRDVGLKDLGALLPGHGGMLDRIDGLLLAMPVGYYAVALVT